MYLKFILYKIAKISFLQLFSLFFILKSLKSFQNLEFLKNYIVVSLAEIITNVDEVDLIMFNSISNPIQKSNKNNLDVVQLAASVRVTNS